MKRTQKKILGFLGLFVVGVTTVFAAMLPGPEASALSTLTDTLTVTVVGNSPMISIDWPKDGTVSSEADQSINYSFQTVNQIRMIVTKVDKDGVEQPPVEIEITPETEIGSGTYVFNLNSPQFGYGEYTIKMLGYKEGDEGSSVPDESIVEFTYLPVIVDVGDTGEDGNAVAHLDYDEDNNNIDHFKIDIIDKDGNVIVPPSPIVVNPPEETVTIPFSEYNLPEGEYTIATTAYDKNGNPLYTSYMVFYNYNLAPEPEPEPDHEDIPVPNTGRLFGNLNVSRTDYLVTGLIIFFAFGIGGLVFVLRGRKSDGRNRKK